MIKVGEKIREIRDFDVVSDFPGLASETNPVVLRGIASHWPLVQQARFSDAEATRYLLEFYRETPVTAFVSQSDIGGRLFYTDDLADTNFTQTKMPLDRLLAQLHEHRAETSPATIYMGSMALDHCLPGLRDQNSLPLDDIKATVRIWIGNRTMVAAHYDVMDNIACVCAGRRRFTLFPPDQLPNLYVGPLDFTPAGQPVSLVDARNPNLDQHPRFSEALEQAQSAELDPGDAIFVPSMWWHQVEALEDFNILINHWWRDVPAHMGAPGDALLHALLSIRDLPPAQRDAWQGLFNHYVFAPGDQSTAHIPKDRLGVLGEINEDEARKICTLLRNKLNR